MRVIVAGTIALLLGMTGAQAADQDLQSWCDGFADRNKVSREPCGCIVKAIGTNETLKAEMMTKDSPDDYHATGSAALHAAVDHCVPPKKE